MPSPRPPSAAGTPPCTSAPRRLLADLQLARGDGRHPRLLAQLAKVRLLLLDDFIVPAQGDEARDLLEVIDDRSQLRSTMVVSQLPVERWHPCGVQEVRSSDANSYKAG